MHDAEFGGKCAFEKALKKTSGIRPLPWTIVLRHFNAYFKAIHGPAYRKAYKRLYEGGRLRMQRVYCIPRAQSAAQNPAQSCKAPAREDGPPRAVVFPASVRQKGALK